MSSYPPDEELWRPRHPWPSLSTVTVSAGLFGAAAGGAAVLQRAGSIAAIVAASVAVLGGAIGSARWWWANHRVRGVKPRVFLSGDTPYFGVTGLPANTGSVSTFISDGEKAKTFGPHDYEPDAAGEIRFPLRQGTPRLNEAAGSYSVEILTFSIRGDRRRVFKGKVSSSIPSSETLP